MISQAIRSVTSLPALESGLWPCVGRDGRTIDLFGLDHAHVNHSASRPSHGKEKDLTIPGISAQRGSISSESASLASSLGSRLRAKMESLGSTTFSITWKDRVTPAGRMFSQQQARALTTSASGPTSLPTPCARDGRDISTSNAFLSQRDRHSPSLATRLLESGVHWQAITPIYCLAMGLPLEWEEAAPKDTATHLTRKRLVSGSKP